MKAVIFCNEKNDELLPMTGTMPKAMLPVCGKMMLKYMLDSLSCNGVTHAIIADCNYTERLRVCFPSGSYKNVVLDFVEPEEIQGYEFNDAVVFVSRPCLFNMGFDEAVKAHDESNAEVTLITKQSVSSVLSDRISLDESGRVVKISSGVSSKRNKESEAGTGIWIISANSADRFITGYVSSGKIDAGGFTIRTYADDEGYYCPVNDAGEYIKCNNDAINMRVPLEIAGHKSLSGIISADASDYDSYAVNVSISAPVYIGRNVKIGEGSVIGEGTVIGDNVTIGKNVKLHGCIIMNGVYIGDRAECSGCVVCRNATLLSLCRVNEDSVIGESAVIGENSVVEGGVKVWNGKHIERNTTAVFDVRYGSLKPLCIGDDGIYGETGGEMSAFSAVKAGMSLVNAGKKIAVGYRGAGNASRAVAMALASGISSSGGDVLFIGECTENELAYITKECGQELGVYAESGSITKIKLFSKYGFYADEETERRIEQGLCGNTLSRAPYFEFGEIFYGSQMRKLYEMELAGRTCFCRQYDIDISTSNNDIKNLCEKFIKGNKNAEEKIVFQISSDGRKASAFSESTGFVFYEKLIMLCCKSEFEKGNDVSLPYSFSLSVDELAAEYDRKVLRFSERIPDEELVMLAAEEKYLNDGIILSMEIVNMLCESCKSFSGLVDTLPKKFASSRFVSCDSDDMEFMRILSGDGEIKREGVWIKDKNGDVFLKPSRSGKSIMLYAESFSSETASEICSSYEDIIRRRSN